MAPRGTHTVFGFDSGLDWWPTAFVNGISSNRVCSACGLVPSNIAMLPCRHVLCKPCYDGCTSNSNRCCLDGEDILPDDVVWSTFSVDSFLDRKIQCWNASNGCDVSGAVSKVMEHFINKCQHHAVLCPRCKQSIAHKDIVNHIQSGLCTQAAMTESVTSEDTASGVEQIVTALGNLDTKVSSLQASFQDDRRRIADAVEMSLERVTRHSPVVEWIHGLDSTLKENVQLSRSAITEVAEAQAVLQNNISDFVTSLEQAKSLVAELEALPNRVFEAQITEVVAIRDTVRSDTLSTVSAAVRREIVEKLKGLEGLIQERMSIKPASEENLERCHNEVVSKLHCVEAVVQNALSNDFSSAKALEWTIEEWSEVKSKDSAVVHAYNPDYFNGYFILPGAKIEKDSAGTQSLHVSFRICKGKHDDEALTWPIKKKLFLWLVHPTDKLVMESVYLDTALQDLVDYRRPFHGYSRELWSLKGVQLTFLEERGFVKDDKLTVRFEVLP